MRCLAFFSWSVAVGACSPVESCRLHRAPGERRAPAARVGALAALQPPPNVWARRAALLSAGGRQTGAGAAERSQLARRAASRKLPPHMLPPHMLDGSICGSYVIISSSAASS